MPPGILFVVGLATTWDFPGFQPIFKDTRGNGQPIPHKTDHQLEVEKEDPKVLTAKEKKKIQTAKGVAKKKENAKRVNDGGGGYNDGTQSIPNDNHHSIHPSPHESADESVHNYDDINGGKGEESPPRIEPFVKSPCYPPRFLSWFSFMTSGRGFQKVERGRRKLVATRKDLEHIVRLYTDMSKCYKDLKEEHSSCGPKIEMLTKEKDQLSAVNKDQAFQIQELKAELFKKSVDLEAAERVFAEGVKEREKLVAQLSQTGVEKFDCIRKLLPSHEYKQSLSEPFNMAIHVGWGRGLSEGRTEKEIIAVLSRVENFDAYFDRKLYPMYDKLFEKEYPFVMKIASGYHHTVADLLKIHPDPAPSGSLVAPTISSALVVASSN
ncbi:hypothetical protein Tco_1121207 [Tanacetum coccineum]|uniref:Uncharacterized protein n=1 Tax=Tanacetum coccineum TaxID=301880 RepID=A0ABQ5IX22_9ASTR